MDYDPGSPLVPKACSHLEPRAGGPQPPGAAQGLSEVTQDMGTQRLRGERYAKVKGQTCFQSLYQEQPSEREAGRPGGQAGGHGRGRARPRRPERRPRWVGEREKGRMEGEPGRNQPQGPLPRGGAARVTNPPGLPSCQTLPSWPHWTPEGWSPLEQPWLGDWQSPPHCTPSHAPPTTLFECLLTPQHPVLASASSRSGLLPRKDRHAPGHPELSGCTSQSPGRMPTPHPTTWPAGPPHGASRAGTFLGNIFSVYPTKPPARHPRHPTSTPT